MNRVDYTFEEKHVKELKGWSAFHDEDIHFPVTPAFHGDDQFASHEFCKKPVQE